MTDSEYSSRGVERPGHHRAAHFGVKDVGELRGLVAVDLQRVAAVQLIIDFILLQYVLCEFRVRNGDERIQLRFRFDVIRRAARQHQATRPYVQAKGRALTGCGLVGCVFLFLLLLIHVTSKIVHIIVEREGLGVQARDSFSSRFQFDGLARRYRYRGFACHRRQQTVSFRL